MLKKLSLVGMTAILTVTLAMIPASAAGEYAITFSGQPVSIARGSTFGFMAHVRGTEEKDHDYGENTLIRISVTPAGADYTLHEKDGQKIIDRGQNTGSMDFVLPRGLSSKSVDITAMFESDGTYTVDFALMEPGVGGRIIASDTLTIQVGGGGTGTANPGTGTTGKAPLWIGLPPLLTLLLFAALRKLYRQETTRHSA